MVLIAIFFRFAAITQKEEKLDTVERLNSIIGNKKIRKLLRNESAYITALNGLVRSVGQ